MYSDACIELCPNGFYMNCFPLLYLAQINLEFLFVDKKPQYIYMCNIQLRFLHSMNAPTVYQVTTSKSICRGGCRPFVGAVYPVAPTQGSLQIMHL